MNKKGFTLVELLAVIALLAILVLLALPNILKLFNQAKKNIFLTEARTIYSESLRKYSLETIKGNKVSVISSNGENKLDISGNIEYIVKIDNGKIKEMKVKDKNYYISFSGGNINDLTTDDIDSITDDKNYDLSLDTNKSVNNCTFDGNLVQGAEYVNGQYTYRYMQESNYESWQNIEDDGWGVILIDKNSTDPINTPLCTSINEKPIVSMSFLFYGSKATTLDLSSFDTSNVTDMSLMFANSKATTLDLSSFDTSKVTNMLCMFYGSQATQIIGLDKFNTRNVTNMSRMFRNSQATTLDLSSFDTSNVTNMREMFYYSEATTIYVSNKWTTSGLDKNYYIFENSTNLIGGEGTTYSSSNPNDKTYAHIDGGVSNPGYFTYKAN